MENYNEAWQQWREDPEKYWETTADNVVWTKRWDKVVDTSDPRTIKWFVGGELNLCYNSLDRHVEEGYGDKTCIIHESYYTKQSLKLTYKELLDQVSRFAGVLHDFGVTKNDLVLINLPMIPEIVVAIFATIRLGATYTVMIHGYNKLTLKERLEELKPKVIISTNCIFVGAEVISAKSILDASLESSQFVPAKCIILQRKCRENAKLQSPRDIDWAVAMEKAKPHGCVAVESNHPVFIIYTSGSTGKPKGIMHSVVSVAVGLYKDNFAIFNNKKDGVVWGMSQLSWIAGQIIVCFAPLLERIATVVYEGPILDPDVEDIHRILATHEVSGAFIPTDAFRSLRRKDPNAEIARKYGPFKLVHILTGGSPMDQATSDYARNLFNTVIVQIYAQTEMSTCMTIDASDPKWADHYPQLASAKPCPGWDLRILRDDQTEADVGEIGNMVIKMPLGPGIMTGIFNNENMFMESYLTRFPASFPSSSIATLYDKAHSHFWGYYDTKDQGKFDAQGFLYVTNRTDSVFKINGTRYSLDGIQKVILSHQSIAECTVVLKTTITDEKTQQKSLTPFAFFVLRAGAHPSKNLSEEIVEKVANEIGVELGIMKVFRVQKLPRLMSGKPAQSMIQIIVNSWPKVQEQSQSADEGINCIYSALKAAHL